MLRIVQKDPFYPILSLFDEFLNHSATEDVRKVSETESVSAMALDLSETEKEYRVYANLPGIKKEGVKITLDKNQLAIEATHQKDEENEKYIYHHRERFNGKYYRKVYLPENVDTNNIKATMENGILELLIPKAATKPQTFINID